MSDYIKICKKDYNEIESMRQALKDNANYIYIERQGAFGEIPEKVYFHVGEKHILQELNELRDRNTKLERQKRAIIELKMSLFHKKITIFNAKRILQNLFKII
jgi:uncharacterized protein YcgL (UPF0745 family)